MHDASVDVIVLAIFFSIPFTRDYSGVKNSQFPLVEKGHHAKIQKQEKNPGIRVYETAVSHPKIQG